MALFRPSWFQDGRLLFLMYTRGIFTERKPKECNITLLLAAVTFYSEKCKATWYVLLHTASLTSTWGRCRTKSDGRRLRNYNTEEEGSTHSITYKITTACPRRNVPDFGRVFLMLKYTDITQNTYYIQSWTVTEIWPEKFEILTAVTHLLITKYILKLAWIYCFCNNNICT